MEKNPPHSYILFLKEAPAIRSESTTFYEMHCGKAGLVAATSHIDYETKMILFIVVSGRAKRCTHHKLLCSVVTPSINLTIMSCVFFFSPVNGDGALVLLQTQFECLTFCLSASLSSLQALSCFFQLSTLAEDSCSASTSLALFSLKVCSSVSHFLALVLLWDKTDMRENS